MEELKNHKTLNTKAIKYFFSYVESKDKRRILYVILLSCVSAIAEIISIGAVIPFIAIIASPEKILDFEFLTPLINFFQITSPKDLIVPISIGFVIAVIISTLVRIALVAATLKTSVKITHSIAVKTFKNIVNMHYEKYASHNSSEIIAAITVKTNIAGGMLLIPIMDILSSLVISFAILAVIFSYLAEGAVFVTFSFILIYYIIANPVKKKVKRYGSILNTAEGKRIKSVQETVGGIRDVIIDHTQKFYTSLFAPIDYHRRESEAKIHFLQALPRNLIEMAGMLVLIFVGFYLFSSQSLNEVSISILGGLALTAQKLLPLFQKIYSSYVSLISYQDHISSLNYFLGISPSKETRMDKDEIPQEIDFFKKITLSNVSFAFNNTQSEILKNINLSISKGEKIGIVGQSGAGKSTLADLIMGLLKPTCGQIKIDDIVLSDKNMYYWQRCLSHVPQKIFISDGTFFDNIAFGVAKEDIDENQVVFSAKLAQLHDFIINLKDGYSASLGEGGAKLSGGQRQRLAIARAIYKNSSVLILDEATSALDSVTERKIINKVNNLNKTIIMIAHRLSSLKHCDRIFMLEDKKIKTLTFNELMEFDNQN